MYHYKNQTRNRKLLVLIFLLSLNLQSQKFGLSFTKKLSRVDKTVTLIKSEFNDITFDINDNEVIGVSNTNSYFYFFRENIGIFLEDDEFHKGPILLSGIKLITKDLKNKKIVFFSEENHVITVDYELNNILWSYGSKSGSIKYKFEKLSIADDIQIENSDFFI